ncbi:MAG TPA: hypothetical protein DD434_03595 [Bacteroidales bacterium]|nr:hypothetical protein [Bacteroidales bacterium]
MLHIFSWAKTIITQKPSKLFESVLSANRFFIGSNVTNTMPFRNVIINAPANILLKPVEDVIIQSDFEVVSGASFEIKINNSDENTCL